ncbi:MAG: hypothetical protein WA160_09805 [Pseudobdellovibrio sp.]
MKKIIATSLLLSAALGLTHCSGGSVEHGSLLATNPSNSGQTAPGTNTGTETPGTSDPLAGVDLQGRVDSKDSFNNALTFDFDKIRGEFIIMLPMPSGGNFFSPMGSFSKYPDITFSSLIDSAGRIKFAVRIPVKYILKGSSFLPAASLPNGDALPAMPAGYGELPSLALNFPQSNNTQVTLYLGVNAIGLFTTLPDNVAIPFGFQLAIKNSDKSKTYGFLSYIPKKGTYAPGLFISTIISPAVARILEDYFHL